MGKRYFDAHQFSQSLKRIMKSKRLRQKDLADISGLSIGTVKQYTAGLRVPEKHNLMLLSKALDVSENYLLGVKDG